MEGLCMLCREHITNPLPLETLGRHIRLWLPPELEDGFIHLHAELSRQHDVQLVCLHCYIREVYQWVLAVDGMRARQFLEVFSFGFGRKSFEGEETHPSADMEEQEREWGLCDECGEFSESLTCVQGEWICDDCAPFR